MLAVAAHGGTVRAIARTLGLSPKTVENRVTAVNRKLGTTTKREAAAEVARRGWLDHIDDHAVLDSVRGVRHEKTQALTPRELEILTEFASGGTTHAVAVKLGVANKTIEHAVTRINHKIGTQSRDEAVRTALKRGWLPHLAHVHPSFAERRATLDDFLKLVSA